MCARTMTSAPRSLHSTYDRKSSPDMAVAACPDGQLVIAQCSKSLESSNNRANRIEMRWIGLGEPRASIDGSIEPKPGHP